MSSFETKSKILDAATKLFNQYGLANVRLQMIANETGISIGNLAYHFKNKEAIIESMSLNLQDEFLDILAMFKQRNDFLDFDFQLEEFYTFVISNPYYFTDALDIKRNYPNVPVFKKGCAAKMLYQIINRFTSNAENGLLKKEPVAGYYEEEGLSIWGYIVFLVPFSTILGQSPPSLIAFKKHIWLKFVPHLTAKGKEEFVKLISTTAQITLN